MDPSQIQSLLVQKLATGGGQPAAATGAGAVQPQTSGANLMAQLAQKAMLMKALQGSQNAQAAQQATNMLPGTNTQMANDPQMSAMVSGQMDPAVLAQLQQAGPMTASMPGAAIPGASQ